jgi:hypothetical protein
MVGVLGIGDIQGAMLEHTSIYLIWNLRFLHVPQKVFIIQKMMGALGIVDIQAVLMAHSFN